MDQRTQINGVTQICDATAVRECFKQNPTNRQEKCKDVIEQFKIACEEKAKEFRDRIDNSPTEKNSCGDCKV